MRILQQSVRLAKWQERFSRLPFASGTNPLRTYSPRLSPECITDSPVILDRGQESQTSSITMKLPTNSTRFAATLAIPALALAFSACDVKKTQEGEMPKVNVEGGQMPKYDVEPADVKVEQKEKTITVPDVDIITPDEKKKGGNVEPGDAGRPSAPATSSESAPPPAPANP